MTARIWIKHTHIHIHTLASKQADRRTLHECLSSSSVFTRDSLAPREREDECRSLFLSPCCVGHRLFSLFCSLRMLSLHDSFPVTSCLPARWQPLSLPRTTGSGSASLSSTRCRCCCLFAEAVSHVARMSCMDVTDRRICTHTCIRGRGCPTCRWMRIALSRSR